MGWQTEWKALSGRITSLLDAGQFYAEMLKVYSSDSLNGAKALIDSASEIFKEIGDFINRTVGSLPHAANVRLLRFFNDYDSHFRGSPTNPGEKFERVLFCLTALRSLQSDVDYLLADTEVLARSLVERAFLHLQRGIMADRAIRETWRKAYGEGETECERLGMVHLLLHGIWAFKSVAPGERTDLVLGTRLEITPQIESAAEALVLTEWKVVRKASELGTQADQAFLQARLYGTGSLAGFELSSRRYLVIVSENRLDMPSDRSESGVDYQYKNIAVKPSSPSKAAKPSRRNRATPNAG